MKQTVISATCRLTLCIIHVVVAFALIIRVVVWLFWKHASSFCGFWRMRVCFCLLPLYVFVSFDRLLFIYVKSRTYFICLLISILSHNLWRSSLHHRLLRIKLFLSCRVFSYPSLAGRIHFCPTFNIVFPPNLLSTSSSFFFKCAL